MKDKILITGTGRSGTTFLVKLFTYCGFDTGYSPATLEREIDEENSGAEWNYNIDDSPLIIKSPGFCTHLETTAKVHNWNVRHVVISLRPYSDVVQHHLKRENLEFIQEKRKREYQLIQGYATQIGLLMEQLVRLHIPYTIIEFPESVDNCDYIYKKLEKISDFPYIPYDVFEKIHKEIADKNKVHYRSSVA